MDLSSRVSLDSGYKFLCYQPLGISDGWVAASPIYLSALQLNTGRPWWDASLTISGDVKFYYFEIRDV